MTSKHEVILTDAELRVAIWQYLTKTSLNGSLPDNSGQFNIGQPSMKISWEKNT